MAGFTLLAALKPAIAKGMRVALVDPAPMPEAADLHSPSFDDRATALSEQALSVFETLGVRGLSDMINPILDIEVSDRGHLGFHAMSSESSRFGRYGAVIANHNLGQLLWRHVADLPVQWRFSAQVNKGKLTQAGTVLTLENGKTLSSELCILCEGGRSGLADQFGLAGTHFPFRARARIATVKTSLHHQGKAFERFTGEGPIALLPFGDFSALVWTIPDDLYETVPSEAHNAIDYLNQHFGQRLGKIEHISEWHEYPLAEKSLSQIATHGVLALGNSAATLHPVAGQGFNLAIRGITRAAKRINEQWLKDSQIPTFAQLNELAEEIHEDQRATVRFSRELINVFSSDNPLVQLGRGIGLNSLDRHPQLSKTFALASMGLLAGTPSLSSGA
jgi:2-octaprenyl-6-methoxyphenol hydroxylase